MAVFHHSLVLFDVRDNTIIASVSGVSSLKVGEWVIIKRVHYLVIRVYMPEFVYNKLPVVE